MRGNPFFVRCPKASNVQKQAKVLETQKKGSEYHDKLLNKKINELRKKIQDLKESQTDKII